MDSIKKSLEYVVPFLGWLAMGAALGAYVSNPMPWTGMGQARWERLAFEVAPLATWLIYFVVTLKGLIFEHNSKVTWRFAVTQGAVTVGSFLWSGFDVAWLFGPCLLTVLMVAFVFLHWLMVGALREYIETSLNLIRYGVPYERLDSGEEGTAEMGNILDAPLSYNLPDGEGLVVGIARLRKPTVKRLAATIVFTLMMWKRRKYLDPRTAPLLRARLNGHAFIESGAGGGKSDGWGVANVEHWAEGGVIVLDPSDEIYATTARCRREKHGNAVYRIKPGAADTDAMNIMGEWLDPDADGFLADCDLASSFLFPDEGESGGGNGASQFFKNQAKGLWTTVTAMELTRWRMACKAGGNPERPTAMAVRKFFSRAVSEVMDDIIAIDDKVKKNPNLFGKGTEILGTELSGFIGGDMKETFPNTLDTIKSKIRFLAIPSIRNVLCGMPSGKGRVFDPRELLNGNTSLYLGFTLSLMQSTPQVAQMVLGPILQTFYKAEGRLRGNVLVWLDELALLRRFDAIHKEALAQGRKTGLRLVALYQSREAVDQNCGKGTFAVWEANAAIKISFALGSPEDAEKLQNSLGKCTIRSNTVARAIRGGGNGGTMGGADDSTTVTTGKKGRWLLDQSELQAIERDFAIVRFRWPQTPDPGGLGAKPLLTGAPFWKNRDEFIPWTDPNPYARKDGEPALLTFDLADRAYETLMDGETENKEPTAAQRVFSASDAELDRVAQELGMSRRDIEVAAEWEDASLGQRLAFLAESDPEVAAYLAQVGYVPGQTDVETWEPEIPDEAVGEAIQAIAAAAVTEEEDDIIDDDPDAEDADAIGDDPDAEGAEMTFDALLAEFPELRGGDEGDEYDDPTDLADDDEAAYAARVAEDLAAEIAAAAESGDPDAEETVARRIRARADRMGFALDDVADMRAWARSPEGRAVLRQMAEADAA